MRQANYKIPPRTPVQPKPPPSAEGRHGAEAGRGHGLPVPEVVDVARGEDAVHGRRGREAIVRLQDDVASIEFQLSLEDLGRGRVPDGQEEALHLEVGRLARLCIPDTDPLYLGFPQY